MRKLLLALAACGLLLPAAQAQTERGSKLLGVGIGNLSYSRPRSQVSVVSASLFPTAAIFAANNLALGTTLNLGYGRQRSGPYSLYREFSYGLSPFVRYYLPGSGQHRVFLEAGGDLTRLSARDKQNSPYPGQSHDLKNSTSIYGYHGNVGYAFFLTPTAALEASAGYYRVAKDILRGSRNEIDVRIGFSVYLPAGGAN